MSFFPSLDPANRLSANRRLIRSCHSGSQVEVLEPRRLLAADLRPVLLEAPVGVVRGGYASVVSRVVNEGDAPTGYYRVSYYASRDSEITTADTLLRTVGRYSLAAGASAQSIDSIYIPPAFATGTWRIGVVVDVAGSVAESDEANNGLAARTTEIAAAPVIDLAAVQVDAPPILERGTTLSVATTVENRGWSPSGSYRVDYVLSANDSISSSDLVLKSVTRASLGGGVRQNWIETLTVPANLASGSYRLGVVVDPLNTVRETDDSNNAVGAAVTSTVPPPAADSGFRITFSFNGFTTAQRAIFRAAADRWSQIIRNDLPDVVVNGLTIDDLRIVASSVAIDGANNVLGDARNTGLRAGTSIPYAGVMRLDSADVALLESRGKLKAVVMHEIGHLLGIGGLWGRRRLLAGAGGAAPTFLGKQATAAYNELFGANASGVPVEGNNSRPGSRDVHWRESVFDNELMTPRLNGSTNPISRVTVASLADLGYVVDLAAADPFAPPAMTAASAAGAARGTGQAALIDGDDRSAVDGSLPWDDVCWCPHCAPRAAELTSTQAEPDARGALHVPALADSRLATTDATTPLPTLSGRDAELIEALARRLSLDTECRNRARLAATAKIASHADDGGVGDVATTPTASEPEIDAESRSQVDLGGIETALRTNTINPLEHSLDRNRS